MKAVIFQDPEICVPGWVVDLDSFLRWVDSEERKGVEEKGSRRKGEEKSAMP